MDDHYFTIAGNLNIQYILHTKVTFDKENLQIRSRYKKKMLQRKKMIFLEYVHIYLLKKNLLLKYIFV